MPPPATLAWLFPLLAWTLAAAGALLLLWSLFRDRPRGRRRCPRCWYDMTGIPGLRCPECGREQRRERRLHKTRRRWRLAGVATLLLVAGHVVGHLPRYRDRGWPGLVPSTVLVCIAPADLPPDDLLWRDIAFGKDYPFVILNSLPTEPSASEFLLAEAWSRLHTGSLTSWQARIYLRWLRRRPLPLVEVMDRELPDASLCITVRNHFKGLLVTDVRLPGGKWIADVSHGYSHVFSLDGAPSGPFALDVRLRSAGRTVYEFSQPVRAATIGSNP